MSQTSKAIYGVAIAMHSAVIALWAAAYIAGREVLWHYPLATAAVLLILSTAATVRICMKPQEPRVTAIAIALLLLSCGMLVPLAVGANSWLLCANIATAIVAAVRVARPMAAKVIVGTVFSLALSVLLLILSVTSVVIGLRHEEVVYESVSPNGQYTAQVVAVSAGAVGGDTQVVVHETATQIRLGVCTIEKPAEVLTFLETYRSHELVEIVWQDADTLHVTADLEYDVDTTYDMAFE